MIDLIVLDTDQEFLDAMSRYVRETRFSKKIHLRLFSDKDRFAEFVRFNGERGVFLIEAALADELEHEFDFELLIRLVEMKVKPQVGTEEERLQIAKIQPLDRLLTSVSAIGSEQREALPSFQGDTEVISVTSSAGGAGKTVLAANLARQLSARGKQVLLLNLEPGSSGHLMFSQTEGKGGLSQAFYYAKTQGERLSQHILDCIERDPETKLHLMMPVQHLMEWDEVTEEDIRRLLEALLSTGSFDYIVIDAFIGGDVRLRPLYTFSEIVYWVLTDDVQYLEKSRKQLAYRHHLLKSESLQPNIHYVLNKDLGTEINDLSDFRESLRYRLPYVPEWKAVNDPGEWFKDGEYRRQIDRIAMDILSRKSGGLHAG